MVLFPQEKCPAPMAHIDDRYAVESAPDKQPNSLYCALHWRRQFKITN